MIFALLVPLLLLLVLGGALVAGRQAPLDLERRRLRKGIELFRARRYADAYIYFDKAVLQGRNLCTAYLYRGKCQVKLDNLNSALFDLTTALSFDNSIVEGYLERGKIYLGMKDAEKAQQDFDRAFFYSQGKDPEVLRYRGLTFFEREMPFKAAKDLYKAAELGDEDACHRLMQPPFHGFWRNDGYLWFKKS